MIWSIDGPFAKSLEVKEAPVHRLAMATSCGPPPPGLVRVRPLGKMSDERKGASDSVICPLGNENPVSVPVGQNWFSIVPFGANVRRSRRGNLPGDGSASAN